jgi:hypothetical protein
MVKTERLSNRSTKAKNAVFAYGKAKVAKLVSFATKLKLLFVAIPGWVKSRPQAFKDWRKADKKKKKYRSFQLQKRIKPEVRFVPTAGQLLKQSFRLYRKNFWIFFCLMLTHAVLYYIFIRGASTFDFKEVQESIKSLLGSTTSATGTFALFGTVIGSQQQRDGSQFYSFLTLLFISLANIWVIRRLYAGSAFRIRDALYQALSSFVPFVIVLFVITLQALPFSITSYVYITGRTGGLFISGIEDLSFFMIALFSGILSLYWMTPSIIALYAVTLPNMYPMRTIRLTKKIVKFRRLMVFRRIIAFPVIVGLIATVVLLVAIRFIPQYSPLLVEAFPIILLPILHGYYFNLYKSLV